MKVLLEHTYNYLSVRLGVLSAKQSVYNESTN